MSFETKETDSRTRNEFDPNTLRVNAARANELDAAIGATGGIGSLIKPRMDLVSPTGQEQSFLNRLMGMSGTSAAKGISPFETQGFGALKGIYDAPFHDIISQGVNTMMKGTAPTVVNNLTAAGLGRSGAVGEALAGAGANMTLPLLQQAAQNRLGAAQSMGQMGLGLGSSLAAREQNQLSTGLDAAGFGRQGAYNEQVTRPSSLLMSLITGMPTFNMPLGSRGKSETTGWGIDIGQIVGAAAGAAMCWIADVLYGKNSKEAACARYWITIGWQGRLADVARVVYCMVGKTVAKLAKRSRIVRALLRPLFDRAVRAGANALDLEVAV